MDKSLGQLSMTGGLINGVAAAGQFGRHGVALNATASQAATTSVDQKFVETRYTMYSPPILLLFSLLSFLFFRLR
jgi:hypothetical protein